MNKILQEKRFFEVFKNKIIQVIAPASGTTPEKMAMLRSIQMLPLHISHDLLCDDIAYHANTDEHRFQVLKTALLNEDENTIVWALRGGYGCARLLDNLKILPIPKHKKIVIGFSDNTALLLFLSQQWQWPVIHGSVLTQLLDSKQNTDNFMKIADIVSQRITTHTIDDLMPLNERAKSSVSGQLVGGNLTLIENSIGTHWQVQTPGKILFLEEVGEKGYRIDRSLCHLRQAGLFKEAKAIILGQFIEPQDEAVISFALNRFANDMEIEGIPVYKTSQFGHGNDNIPLLYQAPANISFSQYEKTAKCIIDTRLK